jgi:hypothetical protein
MRSRVLVRASSPLLRSTHTLSDSPSPTLRPRSLLHSQNYPGSPYKLPRAQSDDRPRLPGPVLRSPSTPSTNTALGAQATSTTDGSRPRETAMAASTSASQTCASAFRCTCSSCVLAALATAMRTLLIPASFSSCLTSMLASCDTPTIRALVSVLASTCVPFPYSTRAGADALRRFADECTGDLLLEDDHLTGHAQISGAHTAPSSSPAHTHPQYAPARDRRGGRARARPTRARGTRAQHVLRRALQDRGLRPSRRPPRGPQHVPPARSRFLPASLSLSLLQLCARRAPADADLKAQAIIFSGARTQPAARSSPSYPRLRSAARPVAAGYSRHEKS